MYIHECSKQNTICIVFSGKKFEASLRNLRTVAAQALRLQVQLQIQLREMLQIQLQLQPQLQLQLHLQRQLLLQIQLQLRLRYITTTTTTDLQPQLILPRHYNRERLRAQLKNTLQLQSHIQYNHKCN